MHKNYNAFCSVSQLNKHNLPGGALNLPSFFRYRHKISEKPPFEFTRQEFAVLVTGENGAPWRKLCGFARFESQVKGSLSRI